MYNIKTFNDAPNFSIVMPGGCNAQCGFCFNRDKRTMPLPENGYKWAFDLLELLRNLPQQFFQISITGNEPMLSPQLDGVLSVCKMVRDKYTNILLTTNGTNLLEKINDVAPSVHHINISRHHWDELENIKIFGGKYNVGDNELRAIIDAYGACGVNVSLNCVIDDNTDKDFIERYIAFANNIGAYAVRFRKKNGDDLGMTPVEVEYDKTYPILDRGECPVCRTWKRVIHGMDTYWKAAVIEPTDKVNDVVYELVYNTDGKIYTDWDYKKPFKRTLKLGGKPKKVNNSYSGSNSCGSNGCGVSSVRNSC